MRQRWSQSYVPAGYWRTQSSDWHHQRLDFDHVRHAARLGLEPAVLAQLLARQAIEVGELLRIGRRLLLDQHVDTRAGHLDTCRRPVTVHLGLMRQHLDANFDAARIPLANPGLQRQEHIFEALAVELAKLSGLGVGKANDRAPE